jgi:DNA-binding transcriptional regulator YhcF (GntR family)
MEKNDNAEKDGSLRLPFAFERDSRIGLAKQLSDGFARAIKDGLYAPGDILPSIKELSQHLHVSEMTVRGMLRKLVDSGLVNPRRGVGSVVLDSGSVLKRGRVLMVCATMVSCYCHSVIMAVLRSNLLQAGYLPVQVSVVADESGRCDFSQLDQLLGESVALTVVFGTGLGIWKYLEERGVPCVVLGSSGKMHVDLDMYAAFPDFLSKCRRAKVRTMMIPFVNRMEVVTPLVKAASDAGIKADPWIIRTLSGLNSRGRMFRSTFEAFSERLSKGRDWFPDVFFFPDDEMAGAGLYALDIAGVRPPDDVGVVSWGVKGYAPFYRKPVTLLENCAELDGLKFSKFILGVLSGRKLPQGASLRSYYRKGETF